MNDPAAQTRGEGQGVAGVRAAYGESARPSPAGFPHFLTWRERLAHEQMMSLPPCPECLMRTFHKIQCSQWEPVQSLGYYAELEQRKHYRESVRDLGCVCHWRMPPHTHGLTCPMYRTDEEWADHLHEETL